jgi:hypothetical protein
MTHEEITRLAVYVDNKADGDESALDEAVHECKAQEAAGINNDGYGAQIRYLCEGLDYQASERLLDRFLGMRP